MAQNRCIYFQKDLNRKIDEVSQELKISPNRVVNMLVDIGYIALGASSGKYDYQKEVLLELIRMKKDANCNNYAN